MLVENLSLFLEEKKFPVTIIGSGPAGLCLALDLEKKNIPSLVIEAGSDNFSESSQEFYGGMVEGWFPKDLKALRLRQFGGTSGHWGGTCRPLDSYDYNLWPIKKRDLDKYLKEACDILEIDDEKFIDKEINQNIKFIEFQNSNVRFLEKYYKKILQSKLIHLSLKTTALNFEIKNNQVTKLICNGVNFKNFGLKSEFFVLASGGIKNCRILKFTNVVNKKNFLNDLPIGNYFMEHPWKKVGFAVGSSADIRKFFLNSENNNFCFAPTEYFIKNNNILNAGFFINIIDINKKKINDLICKDPNLGERLIKFFNSKKDLCGAEIVSSWEQDPIFENKIVLDNNKDIFGIPRVKIIYKKTQIMKDTIRIILEQLAKDFISNNVGRIAIEKYLYNDEEYLTNSGFHHLGGTRMGNSIINSVVNSDLRVHKLNNLFVAGSSVFPTGGHANPTLTIVQLSLRLSNFLSDQILKKG